MKILTLMILGLMVVGCGKTEPELTPAQQLKALRDSVVGEYENTDKHGNTYKYVFLDTGGAEWYKNGKRSMLCRWEIVEKEIHFSCGDLTEVYRINADKSITFIASLRDRKRTGRPPDRHETYKKIK